MVMKKTGIEIFAEEMKLMREKSGLTQSQAAKKLKLSNGQFISNIERGTCYLPVALIKKISTIYNIDSSWLLSMMYECKFADASRKIK
jgi:transcriptional regulator with XRE-family HTH domain